MTAACTIVSFAVSCTLSQVYNARSGARAQGQLIYRVKNESGTYNGKSVKYKLLARATWLKMKEVALSSEFKSSVAGRARPIFPRSKNFIPSRHVYLSLPQSHLDDMKLFAWPDLQTFMISHSLRRKCSDTNYSRHFPPFQNSPLPLSRFYSSRFNIRFDYSWPLYPETSTKRIPLSESIR